jgi:DNA-binding HxlR family transcriptional regulator
MSTAAPGALLGLVELIGQRHALALLWSLHGGSQSFGVLVAGLGVPEAQVSQRLRALRESGLVEVDESGDYRLTTTGRRLQGLLEPLASWADGDWARMTPRQRTARGAAARGRGEPG